MPGFGTTPSTVGSATQPRVETKNRSIDDIMSTFGRLMQMPPAPSISTDPTPVVSRPSIDPSESDKLESADKYINELIGLLANDLWR